MAIWLEAEIGQFIPREKTEYIRLIIGNAKALEKEQIIQAYKWDRFPCSEDDAEQFYIEMYGGKK